MPTPLLPAGCVGTRLPRTARSSLLVGGHHVRGDLIVTGSCPREACSVADHSVGGTSSSSVQIRD